MSAAAAFQADANGLKIAVRLTPRGGRDRIDGLARDEDGRPLLKVRVSAPPVDGEANKALTAFLAKAFSLRKADVEILSGETARTKIVRLRGDAGAIAERLSQLIDAG